MEALLLPECPVCLQVFNNDDTIPRVLSCGHSACQTCLPQLPQRFQNTIRCPACNQLVNYPNDQGPSALPKNIDLLSFINQQNPNPNPNPNSSQSHKQQSIVSHNEFVPPLWSEGFYTNWKDWVLPMDSISIETSGNDPLLLLHGRITSNSSATSRCCFREGEIVSLLYVGSSILSDSVFNFSYTVRIMQFLNQLEDRVRDELCLILRASSLRGHVCKAYGLWTNLEDGSMFLVCETFSGDFAEKLNKLRNGVKSVKKNVELNWGIHGFAMVGMELCEALASLHSDGLVCGCLGPSCFSLDRFGRVFVNPNEVLVLGRRIRKCIAECPTSGFQGSDDSEIETVFDDLLRVQAFVSPEILFKLLHNEGVTHNCSSSECFIGYFSDVWSLACILISYLVGDSFTEKLFKTLYYLIPELCEDKFAEFLELYRRWVESVSSMLEDSLGFEFVPLHQILCRCLEYDSGSRPNVTDVWKCIRDLLIKQDVDILDTVDALGSVENMISCLTLGNLCDMSKQSDKKSQRQVEHDLKGSSGGADLHQDRNKKVEKDIVDGLRQGKFESTDLQGHLDCITGLAVGGGFLFGSSFDKIVHVWSLQDFSHVQSFRGHEHRVMGVVFVDAAEPLCISGDSGGGIFVWGIGIPLGQEPLKKWYEQKDWRYSGIHALAVSGTEYIYTGSGDKSIKAWSLRDYTLTCTMNGHKSVVSSLAVCDRVLYSGSWDGTIRLWSINDHSPLTVLEDSTPGNVASILSLSVDHNMLAAAHENGCVKLWRNDVLSSSIETQGGAIFALDIKEKWLFMGGWNSTIDVKELSGDELHMDTRSIGSIACNSVITALLYWEGKLIVGFADRIIKVYCYRL